MFPKSPKISVPGQNSGKSQAQAAAINYAEKKKQMDGTQPQPSSGMKAPSSPIFKALMSKPLKGAGG